MFEDDYTGRLVCTFGYRNGPGNPSRREIVSGYEHARGHNTPGFDLMLDDVSIASDFEVITCESADLAALEAVEDLVIGELKFKGIRREMLTIVRSVPNPQGKVNVTVTWKNQDDSPHRKTVCAFVESHGYRILEKLDHDSDMWLTFESPEKKYEILKKLESHAFDFIVRFRPEELCNESHPYPGKIR